MTAFNPGQSPPPVSTPTFTAASYGGGDGRSAECRRWESNPHAPHGAPDFESGAPRRGGNHVSPTSPLLHLSGIATRSAPPGGQSPPPAADVTVPGPASAEGGNRTHTGLTAHRILSPARLPVPPLRR